ncbi:hypothetical protein AAC03nite_04960 [Alicyclobacillus acidoterrestris]|nr:hypothetical protein AAC03nite_04960 [Alicyclobacillus acidoterrestris]
MAGAVLFQSDEGFGTLSPAPQFTGSQTSVTETFAISTNDNVSGGIAIILQATDKSGNAVELSGKSLSISMTVGSSNPGVLSYDSTLIGATPVTVSTNESGQVFLIYRNSDFSTLTNDVITVAYQGGYTTTLHIVGQAE